MELEAIRALQYEGSRAEVALGLKERGNEMVHAKHWKDGRDLYTQALKVLHESVQGQQSSENPKPSELALEPKPENEVDALQESTIEVACYTSRALCNLELSKALLTTPSNQVRSPFILSPST